MNIFTLNINNSNRTPQFHLNQFYFNYFESSQKRSTSNIDINQIMVIENNYVCGIPFIISDQNKKSARECQNKLVKQFSLLCKQLGYEQNLFNCDCLDKFQDLLLLKINFEQDSLDVNSKTLLNNMQLEIEKICSENELIQLHIIPKFILNNSNEDQIAIKVSKQTEDMYELREIQFIEDFNKQHLPYLYGYLRYQEILSLFLKKHDWTFRYLSNQLLKKRKDYTQEQLEQIFLIIFQQMIKAIKYVHSLGIIHRDIKPENIIVDILQQIKNNQIEIINTPPNCVFIDENLSSKSNYKGTTFFRPAEGEQVCIIQVMIFSNQDLCGQQFKNYFIMLIINQLKKYQIYNVKYKVLINKYKN